MEDSTKNGYIAGVISSLASAILIIMGVSIGLNTSGQIILVIGLVFGLLGAGSLLKPESIGQITSQILENIAKNTEEQNRPRYKKEIKQVIINKGDMINITDSKNTTTNISKKSSKKIR